MLLYSPPALAMFSGTLLFRVTLVHVSGAASNQSAWYVSHAQAQVAGTLTRGNAHASDIIIILPKTVYAARGIMAHFRRCTCEPNSARERSLNSRHSHLIQHRPGLDLCLHKQARVASAAGGL